VAAATFAGFLLAACGAAATTPSAGPITIRVNLNHIAAIAGRSIDGVALVTNHTSKAIASSVCESGDLLQVGLTNSQVPFDPASAMDPCFHRIRLRPGMTRIPFTVLSTYLSCAQVAQGVTPNNPMCTSVSGMPSLPSGQYETQVVVWGLSSGYQISNSVAVTLSPKGP
jgi:hypothetical protein